MKQACWCAWCLALVVTLVGCPEEDVSPVVVLDVADAMEVADTTPDVGPADTVPETVVDVATEVGVVSGAVRARWTFMPASCAEAAATTVRARAVGAGGATVGEMSGPCEGSSGELLISSLVDGSYLVVIEALDADGNAAYGASESVLVEGGVTATTELQLLPLDGVELRVRWVFSNGLACVDNGTTHVEVRVVDALETNLVPPETVACGGFFTDPADGTQKPGVLFTDVGVDSAIGASVIVNALDGVGGNVLGSGMGIASLVPGERAETVVTIDVAP